MAEPMSKKAKPTPTGAALFDLTGKVAVVTGGTGVLGSEMCKGLAAAGAKVAVMGRRVEMADAVVKVITDAGHIAMSLPGDVTDPESVAAAKDALLSAWGTIDILVNAAGGNQPGATIGPADSFFEKFDLGAFEQITKLNLNGTILPCQVFGALMAEKKSGSIINISSMAAQQTITRVCGYSASKAAVDNFTSWLAVELCTKVGPGLRVNAIAPGFFLAEQNRALLTKEDGSLTDRGKTIIQNTPAGRFGTADELIGALVYLASDASTFVTGTVLSVDGGFGCFSGV